MTRIFTALAFTLATTALVASAPTSARATFFVRKITILGCHAPSVIDGARFRCEGQTIRLAGVDAPAPRRGLRPAQPFAGEAKQMLVRLTRNDVWCDVEPDDDRRETWMGTCWTDQTDDLGDVMIRAGLVVQNTRDRPSYDVAEREAREAKRGRWAVPDGRKPIGPRSGSALD